MLRKNLLNSKVLKPSSVEPAKQWPRGSSGMERGIFEDKGVGSEVW